MQSDSQQTVSRLSARLLAAQQSGSLDMRVREVVQRNVGTQIPQRLKARQQGFTCAD